MEDREAIESVSFISPKIWISEFEVRGIGKGCAIIKAPDADTAIKVLKSSGTYNGTPEAYSVGRTEQIIMPPCCGLVAEQIVEY